MAPSNLTVVSTGDSSPAIPCPARASNGERVARGLSMVMFGADRKQRRRGRQRITFLMVAINLCSGVFPATITVSFCLPFLSSDLPFKVLNIC